MPKGKKRKKRVSIVTPAQLLKRLKKWGLFR